MKLTLVAIKDTKIGAFQQPACVAALGAAIRAFEDATTNPAKDTDISRHPTDFELWKIGIYDDETGLIEQDTMPQFIQGGNSHVQK